MLASNNDFTVRAAVFVKGHRVSGISEMSYQQVKPIAPGTPNIYASGLKRALYDGDWDSLPDLAGVKPAVAEIVTLPSLEGLEGREYYALQFTGYIRIPGTGMYKFLLTSDDGSSLSIDGHPVVDNNGLHSAVEAAGYLPLAEGFHAIGISYFQKSGGSALNLRVEGPGFDEGVSLEDLLFY